MTPITYTVPSGSKAAGTYSIPETLVPDGYTVAALSLTIAALDYQAAATHIAANCEFSTDGGATWQAGGAFEFQGGGVQGANGNPGVTIYRDAIAGQRIRASITLNRTMTIGGSLTIT